MTKKEKIYKFVSAPDYKPVDREGLAAAMAMPEKSLPHFHKELTALLDEGELVESRKTGRILTREAAGLEVGVLRVNPKGFGFVARDGGEDLYVRGEEFHSAMNGDLVLIRPLKAEKDGRSRWAVYKVLRRGTHRVVGRLRLYSGLGIVTPDNERLPKEIFVTDNGKALDGQKVIVKITDYPADGGLHGEIEEVLGFPEDFGVDVLSIIRDYDFEVEFPKKALSQAEAIPTELSPEELTGRLDLRDKPIITIDGDDSKDLDDAVSLEKTANGWRLGVHIADVSAYVRPGSPLDKEALKRGTSVYMVDRVVPMLPPRLSNGICSLNEGEDRLTLSVLMDMDENGVVKRSEFHKSVIRSSHRMTYNNVEKIFEGESELEERYSDIVPMLRDMRSLSLKLKKRAAERGYIELAIPEAKAILDDEGRAVGIELRRSNEATELIEQFMVAANMAVAKFLCEKNIPAVFRVHGLPDENKLRTVRQLVSGMGINPNLPTAEILKTAEGSEGEAIVSALILRSMAKAVYSTENLGHYGLGADYYCHFTSPIRRYPDLVCHRALKAAIEDDEAALRLLRRTNAEAAKQSSDREAAAEHCERDVLDMKKAEYMEQFVGQDFHGVISSVTSFGFFVALPDTVEGLVSVTSLADDYYVYDEKALCLRGERTHREFRLGAAVDVTLVAANRENRKIEFIVKGQKARKPEIKEATPNGGKQKRKNSGAKQKRVSRVLHRRKNRGRH